MYLATVKLGPNEHVPNELDELVGELLKTVTEAGIDKANLNTRQLEYWLQYAPNASRRILKAVASSLRR